MEQKFKHLPLFQSNWTNDYAILNINSVSRRKIGNRFFSLFSLGTESQIRLSQSPISFDN